MQSTICFSTSWKKLRSRVDDARREVEEGEVRFWVSGPRFLPYAAAATPTMCVKRAVPGQGRIYVVALIHKHKRMPNKAWETEALSAKIITLIVTALLLVASEREWQRTSRPEERQQQPPPTQTYLQRIRRTTFYRFLVRAVEISLFVFGIGGLAVTYWGPFWPTVPESLTEKGVSDFSRL